MKLRSIILSCTFLVTFLQGYPTEANDNSASILTAMVNSYSVRLHGFSNVVIPAASGRISTPSINAAHSISPTSTQTPRQNSTPDLSPSGKPQKQNGLSKIVPSKTPHPTTASVNIPPADPNLAHLIIGAGILIVLVVILGVWINRQRLR
jgi:hypothetical protein